MHEQQAPSHARRHNITAFVLAIALGIVAPLRADDLKIVSVKIDTPYPPIRVASYVFEQPRLIRAWTVRVDLNDPEVELVMTCPTNVPPEGETRCAITSQFAEQQDVQVAINASPFGPYRDKPGEGMDIVGLGACDGNIYSQPHGDFGAFVKTKDGRVDIWDPPFSKDQLATVDDALSGFHVLLHDGKDVSSNAIAAVSSEFAGPQPRTAVGLEADHKILWLFIVDGRNPGYSEGISLAELAQFGQRLKCDSLLNFDGGGSSTLVVQDPKTERWHVINQPRGQKIIGTERLVGNHLGVRIRPVASEDPDAP